MQNTEEQQAEKRSLTVSIAAVVLAVVALCTVGLLYVQPADEAVQGQADADEVRCSGKLPGRVAEIMVSEGQTVRRGDTLAHITSSTVDAKLLQAQSMQQAAQAQQAKAEAGSRSQVITGAYNLWQQALALQEITQTTYNRLQRLYDQGVVSAQKRDEALAACNAARAQAAAAQSQYDMAREGAQREDKAAAAAAAQAAAGTVKEVQSLLEDEYLTAPCDGEVMDIYPAVGELVGTGTPIVSLLKKDQMWVAFNVREDMLSRLRQGATVTVKIPALDMRQVRMRVFHVRDLGQYAVWSSTKSTGDYDSKTFEVKMRPAAPVDGLRPGMSALLAQ